MKKKQESATIHHCDFCQRDFVREKSFIAHTCKYKSRWQSRDQRANQIAFQCWLEFHRKNSTPKNRTQMDFIKCPYYTAFVKFANYCIEIKALDVLRYCDWLLENKVSIDKWASDVKYNDFLIYFLKTENHLDALARSIATTIELAESDSILSKDCLRYSHKNKICHEITKGKISPWMLYQCDSGIAFIESLNDGQTRLIFDYISPEKWAIKFSRMREEVNEVKALLKQAGY